MNKIKLKIKNELGLHARAAATLVQVASKFDSNILIEKDGLVINGKSIMGVMTLAAAKGHKITVTAEGTDWEKALKEIKKLVEDKFNEE